jgi:tetratricopeptide (TPR) repeat protein
MGAKPARDAGKLRVLCAFRNPILRRKLGRRLETSGFAPATAGTPDELIRAVAADVPDLVLIDGSLGDAEDGGLQLLGRLREAAADVQAVLFPGQGPSEELERGARSLGAQLFRGTKLDASSLRSLVEQTLGIPREGLPEGELLSLCERLRADNPFEALGIAPFALPEEIEHRYERLKVWLSPEALGGTSAEVRRLAGVALEDLQRTIAKLRDAESLEAYRQQPDRDAETEQPSAADGDPCERAQQAYRAGHEQLDQQDWAEALASFERAVELAPGQGEFRACLGWATYLVYGTEPAALTEAIGHARAGMKLAPNHYHPALVLGRLYQFTNRLDLAEKALKRAVQLNPDSVDAVRELRIVRMREHKRPGKGLISKLLGR